MCYHWDGCQYMKELAANSLKHYYSFHKLFTTRAAANSLKHYYSYNSFIIKRWLPIHSSIIIHFTSCLQHERNNYILLFLLFPQISYIYIYISIYYYFSLDIKDEELCGYALINSLLLLLLLLGYYYSNFLYLEHLVSPRWLPNFRGFGGQSSCEEY